MLNRTTLLFATLLFSCGSPSKPDGLPVGDVAGKTIITPAPTLDELKFPTSVENLEARIRNAPIESSLLKVPEGKPLPADAEEKLFVGEPRFVSNPVSQKKEKKKADEERWNSHISTAAPELRVVRRQPLPGVWSLASRPNWPVHITFNKKIHKAEKEERSSAVDEKTASFLHLSPQTEGE